MHNDEEALRVLEAEFRAGNHLNSANYTAAKVAFTASKIMHEEKTTQTKEKGLEANRICKELMAEVFYYIL